MMVKRSDGKPSQEVRRRFSEFADANERMKLKGTLEVKKENFLKRANPFPSKDLNNANLHLVAKTDEELNTRRKALEGWMNDTIGYVDHRKRDEKWAQENTLLHACLKMEKYVNLLINGSETIPVSDDDDATRESKFANEDKA